MDLFDNEATTGKPFLKWAGGKSQLIKMISINLPKDFSRFDTYIEPFVGSGAVLFWVLNNYTNIQRIIINDINGDLTNAYAVIKSYPKDLIAELMTIQNEYQALLNEDERKKYFLKLRSEFNDRDVNTHIKNQKIRFASLLIFLNRTCFNGLYRVNSKNQFNVPFGKYSNPRICDAETIMADSKLLQKVEVLNGDYSKVSEFITPKTFVYFDPPYKPISKTSNFNSYSADVFDDLQQKRLKDFCVTITEKGCSWMLSNSDTKNYDETDCFFDNLYSEFNILRVDARRNINSKAESRGKIKELLINNYNE